jgi:coenzyme Q-binding protein COQ10
MPTVTVSRRLAYSAEQIFVLVADVERYPEFLPWWVAARVLEREAHAYETDQVIRFGMIRERFSSRTVLEPHRRISVSATDGPWRRLELDWSFESLPDEGAEIRLSADIAFASAPLQALFERVLTRAIGRIIEAFERRARQIHGPAPDEPSLGRRGQIDPGT